MPRRELKGVRIKYPCKLFALPVIPRKIIEVGNTIRAHTALAETPDFTMRASATEVGIHRESSRRGHRGNRKP